MCTRAGRHSKLNGFKCELKNDLHFMQYLQLLLFIVANLEYCA